MIPNEPEQINWFRTGLLILLAFLGGCMGYVMRALDAGQKVSFTRTIFEGVAAGFFGVIIGLICMENNMSMGWSSAIIGVLSWLGARTTLKALEPLVYSRMGMKPRPEENPNDKVDK